MQRVLVVSDPCDKALHSCHFQRFLSGFLLRAACMHNASDIAV